MGREFGAVVLGYVVMFVFIMVAFSLMYLVLGTERAFQPGSYDPSGTWITGSIVLGLLGAIAGGWVCAAIARQGGTPKVLALVVVVLGIVMAIPVLTAGGESMVREGAVPMTDAMNEARQPVWIALLNPFIGAIGVMVGARYQGSD